MRNALLMRGRQRIGERDGPLEEPAEGEAGSRQELGQRAAAHQLHRDEVAAVGFFHRIEIGAASLARTLIRFPIMTLKIVAAIHWQALRLWLKGCPTYEHPDKGQKIAVVTARRQQ
jgi:DUF1365 family protein